MNNLKITGDWMVKRSAKALAIVLLFYMVGNYPVITTGILATVMLIGFVFNFLSTFIKE